MAFDWSKLNYSQLLALAQKQDPSIAAGWQRPSEPGAWNDPMINKNNATIDLSSLGIPGKAGITAAPGQGLIFDAPDPGGSSHRVAMRAGANGSVTPTYYNQGDSFLDKMIPLMVMAGTGAVGANALGFLGGAADGTSAVAGGAGGGSGGAGATSAFGGTSMPALSAGEVAGTGAGTAALPTAAEIGAAGGGLSSLGGGASAATGLSTLPAAGMSGAGPIGSGAASIPADISGEIAGGAPTLTGAQIGGAGSTGASYLDTLNGVLGSPLGKLGTTLLGSFIGSQPNQQMQNLTKQVDPRIAPYIYGQGGVLQNAANLYNANPSGTNDLMRQGWQSQIDALNNPALKAGYANMMSQGQGLLNRGVAANPFTTGQTQLLQTPAQFAGLLRS
jgi:hypothetical protein